MENDNSNIGNKITNIYKQNPVCKGYYIVSELKNVLKTGYYESLLGDDSVDWFVIEVENVEKKVAFCFRNTKKDIELTEEDKNILNRVIFGYFIKKQIISSKVRDHCHLTGKYRKPLHSK